MRAPIVIAPIAVAFALACGGSGSSSVGGDAGVDLDAGADAAPPPVDPSLFDCTSLARPPLARRASSTPECLRDPTCRTTRLVSAHRGAGGQLGRIAPEDTLAAYRAGIAMGVDLVETDPRPTSDGVLVNIHDPTLDRTTDGIGDVDKHTLAEIQALHLRTTFLGDFSCERVPTLVELLATCKGRALVLVDANKTDRVDLLVAAILATDTLDWAVFDTSSLDKIDRALAIEPRLMIQPRVETLADAQVIADKYKAHPPVFFEISASIFPGGVDVVRAAGGRVLVDAFGIDASVRFGGLPSQYLDFYAKGADVVQTDLPDVVLRAIGRGVPP